jgi:hypothetical protein
LTSVSSFHFFVAASEESFVCALSVLQMLHAHLQAIENTADNQGCQIFLGATYQTGKICIPNGHKIYKWPQTIPNGHKQYQMA